MKLAIKNGLIVASHSNNQNIKELYPDCEIIWVLNNIRLEDFYQNEEKGKTENKTDDDFTTPKIDTEFDPRLKWGLEENKVNALAVIEDIAEEYRAKILSNMPGRIAAYEAKAMIAKRIAEAETPNSEDISSLQIEADNRGITVLELAKLIIKKSEEFSVISAYIDGEIQKTKSDINNSKSYKTAWKALKSFEDNVNQKISS
ncbi:hypothetical protein N9O56_01250 [Rickettsiales bacterium]|nr:hypothetical protein [Rickettsiales bacterium]